MYQNDVEHFKMRTDDLVEQMTLAVQALDKIVTELKKLNKERL